MIVKRDLRENVRQMDNKCFASSSKLNTNIMETNANTHLLKAQA